MKAMIIFNNNLLFIKILIDMQEEQQNREYDVIIIGAGAAGIGAAVTFSNQKISYVVFEARLRIGGRVECAQVDGVEMDLGACWIHSFGPKNPLKPYVDKFGEKQKVLSKRSAGRVFIDGEERKPFAPQILKRSEKNRQKFFQIAKLSVEHSPKDLSLYDAGSAFMQKMSEFDPGQMRCTQMLINMKQHYEASSTKQLSAKNYDYKTDSGFDFTPCSSYASFLKKIACNLNIQLNKQVVSITLLQDLIVVRCSDKTEYRCKKIIVSLPLGVLKQGAVKFEPELPEKHRAAIRNLGVGLMNKIILSFSENFWGSVYWISIGCNERGKFPHFYNFSQMGKHILLCFITDDFAKKLQGMTDNQIIRDIIQLLKNIYEHKQEKKIQLRQALITRWGSDQFSKGSYTSFHTGSSPQDCFELRKPVDNKLWMVGEHCHAEHIGTAHGAFNTGKWAAESALSSLGFQVSSKNASIIPEAKKKFKVKASDE